MIGRLNDQTSRFFVVEALASLSEFCKRQRRRIAIAVKAKQKKSQSRKNQADANAIDRPTLISRLSLDDID